ncbi:tetratricopeptide repeat protein [Nonomuraea sp. MG754425]|uniref:tetratricopeptide repeat protein n=1 Tax=Nonomuraea sp. MG754425 TaxID=2570319 RepID=UPI001F3D539A|nr:tetratricopeptide repeat protein [Nonomuraea sp. MG754425]MCF6472143.1 tetratricopeptide repeat protein [Nonomuraea sp. MG754425]
MDSHKVHNERLHALMREAGWNGQSLAEAVNAVGREANLPLTYTRSSVAQWLAGMTPRRPVPHVVAEAQSRRVGRLVTPAEAGFDDGGPEDGGSPLDRLTTLAVATDAANLGASPFRVYSLSGRPPDERNSPVPVSAELSGSVRVGSKDVESAEVMLRLFSDADAAAGSGHVRAGLSLYLADTIVPSLSAAPREIRAELLTVAARLSYQCGVMCYNDELHGFAQQYFQVALRLAAEAREPGVEALALSAMSVQAVSLGHFDHALGLSRAAVEIAGGRLPPAELAWLFGQRAVAHAAAGDTNRALADMTAARAQLKRFAGVDRAPAAALAYQRGLMLALLGDTPRAIAQLEISVRHRPATERHSRAITLSRIAGLQLRHGHLEEAVATWHRFLDDYPAIRSGRACAALALLQAGLRPYRGVASAGALLARATSLQQRLPHLAAGSRTAAVIPSRAFDIPVPFPADRSG